MKLFKKLAGMLLAMIMVLSMSTVAFAAHGTNDNSGSITINDAEKGHTYNAYQVLVLESYNTDVGAYSYKANSDWADWLKSQTQYVSIDAQGYVTWVKDADPAAFAKAALAHAKEASIAPDVTKTADSTTVAFTGLNLGYYLVDTTLGTLCSLDTTEPDVTMQEKNEVPSQTKEVQEDSDGSWGSENTAEIGDTVNYRTTINAKPGAQSYILHDVMSAGLTLNPESITVAEPVGVTKGQDANSGDYHVVTTGFSDGCTFEVVFHQSYLDKITTNTNIVVTYSAVVNEKAQVSPSPNPNETKLEYGEASNQEDKFTPPSETKTYTFKVDVVKTDDKKKVLDGAQFKLYDKKTGGHEIALVKESDGFYRLAEADENGVEYITTVNGKLEIKGFDANTNYYLEETKAPDGYNKLAERVEIAVKEDNLEASVSNDIWQSGGVHIVNKAGDLLPTTGGMGTTILYIIGGVLAIGAGAVLIIRRRTRK
ncbi:SpaH/EbpB family LPXTG-anchored major pilin [Mediterraneibacter glycyrrhizinilyticus]|uniref:SpaH/EbpB family LPXTG-anchored major pilin n=1 Tax=Mediterraneibacter glycyrrhizinilyticus TaxID=342942 RepID=UPI0025A34A56|nr:SpaH/EbpB family LPXTG-anchored major pilin [Mediterraneibacter glycyrrhizinilyticus]MDM8125104.1 SpaH/EbpB family LPXTG-anchored major pilin [Mediterraneibacter glycyrrhizinilyticus]